ncbi:MAG: ACT domain-containing protein [Cohaesibacter sp.]|nr:ACT domain-containing protein [Cohaesibacter sp.]
MIQLELTVLEGEYAICWLPAESMVPTWATQGEGFVSVSHCEDEVSIVCRADAVPQTVKKEAGWTAIKLNNLLGLDEPGAVLSAVKPVSTSGFGVFVISTYYRDYMLVRSDQLERLKPLMMKSGHRFTS